MANQQGIVLFRDNYQNIRGVMTQAQKGDLLDALMDGSYPGDDQLVRMAYNIFDAAIQRTNENYQKIREQNREKARKRWEKIKEKADAYDRMQEKADAYDRMQKDAYQTQTQTQSQSHDNNKNIFHPPTVDEVSEYVKEHGYAIDPERFIDYYQTRGWELRPGQRMKDWKAAVRTWVKNQKERGWNNDESGFLQKDRVPGQRDLYEL